METRKTIPTFEEFVRRNIGSIRQAINGDNYDLSGLNTTNNTTIVNAINEINGKEEIFKKEYGISPNHVTIYYTKDDLGRETILSSIID